TETLTGSWKRESAGAIEKMTTNTTVLAISMVQRWNGFWLDFWRHNIHAVSEWIMTKGLKIVLLLIGAVLVARFVTWVAQRVTRRLDVGFTESDALVRSEATKHRQAVASVISWVSIAIICVVVAVWLTDI